MAKKDSQDFNPQDSSSIEPRRFDGNLEKNFNDYHLKENQWTYARNAITNSNIGDLGRLGNEPSNRECIQVPSGYSIIGAIHLERDLYVIFSTDNSNSEIGYFQKDTCTYTKIVNDSCLNFSTKHLIYGVSRESSDCNHTVYWADGLNPDRFLNIGDIRVAPYAQPWPNIPWKCEDATPNDDCFICDPVGPPYILDCDKIRLAPLMQPLCFRVEKTASGGNLLNGSYMVVGAYTIGGEKMTDYFPPSNQQPIFDHSGVGGSITIVIENADTIYFDEFELVVISVIGQQTVAKKVGIYSTRQGIITLDIIDPSLPSVPIEQIPVRTPVYDKSDAMYVVNDYLLRVGPTTKLDFNYQPLANQIVTKWQSVEYDAEYYKNGGNKTGYMRDEVYSFFIRWVYDTGDRSASYHIPGRPAFINPVYIHGLFINYNETADSPVTDDVFEYIIKNEYGDPIYACAPKTWEVYNTAQVNTGVILDQYIDPIVDEACVIPGRGKVIREGLMGYWESTERYPDNKPEIWNSNISIAPPAYSGTDPDSYNLCGKPIRHHKFPDNDFHPDVTIFDTAASAAGVSQKIRILGVKFENVKRPLIDPSDPTKGFVQGLAGFEILRGSRQGNRTVIAKGIINNMVEYDIPRIQLDTDRMDINNPTFPLPVEKGLFQNYPYNDIRGDEFLSTKRTRWKGTGNLDPLDDDACTIGYYNDDGNWNISAAEGDFEFKLDRYKKNYFSFHSPETTFANPFLGARELKVYQELDGIANMYYQFPEGHPQHKLMKDLAWLLAAIAGLGTGITAAMGGVTREYLQPDGATSPNPLTYQGTGLNLLIGTLGFGYDFIASVAALSNVPVFGLGNPTYTTIKEGGQTTVSPVFSVLFNALSGVPTFSYYWAEGAEATWRLIKNAVAYQQYALQQYSHCFYDNVVSALSGQSGNAVNPRFPGQRRRYIQDISYVDDQIQSFDKDKKINNLYRNKFVAIKTERDLAPPFKIDESRYRTSLKYLAEDFYKTGNASVNDTDRTQVYKNPEVGFIKPSSTYYAALKQRLSNQYGQLDNITQLPITTCPVLDSCVLVEAEQVIQNGTFTNVINPWQSIPNNYWIKNGADQAETTTVLLDPNNRLQQSVAFIPGTTYKLTFTLVQLSPIKQLNVGFNSSVAPSDYVYITPGTYSKVFTAGINYDSLIFSEQSNISGADCVVDLVISIDNSSSVTPAEWSDQINFIINIINNLSVFINNDSIRIGINIFTNCADITSLLIGWYQSGNPNNTWSSVITAQLILYQINRPPNPGCTQLAGGLCTAWFDLTSTIPGSLSRPSAQKKILIITDGFPTCDIPPNFCLGMILQDFCFSNSNSLPNVPPLINAANQIRSLGGSITVVGTGSPNEIADGEQNLWPFLADQGSYYRAQNFQFGTIANDITQTICALPTIIDDVSLAKIVCAEDDVNSVFSTNTLFNGDVYINRYTEKNTFFYFYNWLFKQPDGSYLDYQKYNMLPYPTYWINTEDFDVLEGAVSLSSLLTGLPTALTNDIGDILVEVGDFIANDDPIAISFNNTLNLFQNIKTPSDYHVLDRPNFGWFLPFGDLTTGLLKCGPGLIIKYGYFYLFNSGVRDFYVESEFNIALRDWDDDPARRHYDHKSYTSLPDMFKTDIIKSGNFYKYDTSLSISKNWFSYVKWGNLQQRSYDPTLAETCFQYRPDRVIYSLQSQYEALRDNWRIFLPNNYKDFLSRVKSIKQINKSGSLILFESDSPVMFQGLDTLETELSTKLTIGDGGLFSQPMQSVMNAERSFEYASCQNRLSVLNTPMGVFWINMDQGKIFQFQSGLKEISMGNVKWWLNQYLPYQLTKYFPNYIHNDNPVYGIGCQTIYDNTNNLIYFTKKDYKPKLDGRNIPLVSYDVNTDTFIGTQGDLSFVVTLGDPRFFDDASWTMSYDLKTETWVSFHDWHPDLTIASKNTFMTTKGNKVWIHNDSCSSYTNYYGVNYPFEVEYTVNTMQTVNTLRSIEYQLEVYKYKFDNCYDRFHVLDFNFDEAVIYNTEQCSGLLKLNITPKNNAPAIIGYPNVVPVGVGTSGQINILYSKEENKYRFNQFWDTTYERGEFPLGSDYPPTGAVNPGTTVLAGTYPERTIWNTGPDGYKRNLNNSNLDYGKNPLQRKKFRHYTTSVLLRRKVSGDRKMLVSITNNKNLYSPR